MKTTNKPGDAAPKQKAGITKTSTSSPKKPGNDPDQTPDREIGKQPKAKPSKEGASGKAKIGFKK